MDDDRDRTRSGDPERDPQIREALASRYGAGPQPSEEEWEAFRQRLITAARARLTRRGVRQRWWDHAARWARPAIPLGLAASLTLAVGLAFSGFSTGSSPESAALALPAAEDPYRVEDVLASAASETLPDDLLISGDPGRLPDDTLEYEARP